MKTKLNKLWIDQHGQRIWARTAKELREKAGGGKISKMYADGKEGGVFHTGYVIGRRWFNGYTPMREVQS